MEKSEGEKEVLRAGFAKNLFKNTKSLFTRIGKQYLILSDIYDPHDHKSKIKASENNQAEQLSERIIQLEQRNKKLELQNQQHLDNINAAAHDLRLPLSRTISLSQLLQSTPLNKDQKEIIEQLEIVNKEGLQLLDAVLELHSIEHEQNDLAEINLSQFIKMRVEKFNEQAQIKNISIHTAIEDDLAITTDPVSLGRIIDNLISNALKFSENATEIFIKVLSVEETVYISVQDQGPGISEEDRKKLFKKFGRLSARPTSGESSIGLGLSIVKSLTEKLNGEITVRSVIGKGTEFTLRLDKRAIPISYQKESAS
ncbi:MAG TPA: HAMP domain-containing sensor histidine kinase [Cyclobacteriaceae bacterium]